MNVHVFDLKQIDFVKAFTYVYKYLLFLYNLYLKKQKQKQNVDCSKVYKRVHKVFVFLCMRYSNKYHKNLSHGTVALNYIHKYAFIFTQGFVLNFLVFLLNFCFAVCILIMLFF